MPAQHYESAAQRDVMLPDAGYMLSPRSGHLGQAPFVAAPAGGPAQREGETGAGDQPGEPMGGQAGRAFATGSSGSSPMRRPLWPECRTAGGRGFRRWHP